MKKILILEDDRVLAKTLKISLQSKRLDAIITHTLDQFYETIETGSVDICIMDRMIEDEDSVDSLHYIREIAPQTKILLLSKKSNVQERICGLETGADDYLTKPFSLAELKLRVKTLLSFHRSSETNEGIMLGEIIFHPEQGFIQAEEELLFLRKRETEILNCLARSIGSVVSRSKITSTLWPENYEPNPNTVDVYIRRLRQKLGKYQQIIETRRGFGYRLVPFRGK